MCQNLKRHSFWNGGSTSLLEFYNFFLNKKKHTTRFPLLSWWTIQIHISQFTTLFFTTCYLSKEYNQDLTIILSPFTKPPPTTTFRCHYYRRFHRSNKIRPFSSSPRRELSIGPFIFTKGGTFYATHFFLAAVQSSIATAPEFAAPLLCSVCSC